MKKLKHIISFLYSFVFSSLILLLLFSCIESSKDENLQPVKKNQQEKSSHDPSAEFPEFKLADSLFQNYKFKEALASYALVARKMRLTEKDERYVYYSMRKGSCYYRLREPEKANPILRKAVKIVDGSNIGEDLKIDLYTIYGKNFSTLEEPDSALFYLQRAVNLELKEGNKNQILQAEIYYSIGSVYRFNLNDFQKAEGYYIKSRDLYESSNLASDEDLIACYYHLATIYGLKTDFEKALNYVTKALNLAKLKRELYENWGIVCYNQMANLYQSSKEPDKAIEVYHKARTLCEQLHRISDLTYAYNNIGVAYLNQEKYLDSEKFYKKALVTARKVKDIPMESEVLLNLGEVWQHLGKIDSAAMYIQKAILLRKKIYKPYNSEISNAYLYQGKLFNHIKQYDSALFSYQRVFIEGIKGFIQHDPSINPTADQVLNQTFFFSTLVKKAEVFRKIYSKTENIENLKNALESYHLLDSVMDLQNQMSDDEYSQLILNSNSKEVYSPAIEVCYLLYEATSQESYIQHALSFMERSKSNVLLRNLKSLEASSKIGVPDSLQAEEAELKSRLALYKSKLREKEEEGVEEREISSIHDQIFNISQRLEKVKGKILSHNPAYFRIKYSFSTISLDEIASYATAHNSFFIEYFIGEGEIYGISIGKGFKIFKKISNTTELDLLLVNFKKGLQEDAFFNLEGNFKQLTSNGYSIYNEILFPLIGTATFRNKKTTLIIIPDENLSTIPFEALLTSFVTSETVDFQSLPYLIKKYSVKYSYSLNIFFQPSFHKKTSEPLIAFDYFFQEEGRNDREQNMILGSTKELASIREHIKGGVYFTQSEATKDNFIHHASSAKIIHLAIHGKADTLNPLKSRLVFYSPKNQGEGSLYFHELYNVKLNAELVVLSACETGIGNNLKGEGVMSLGRAFHYSGASTLIMSLWKINDNSSATIIDYFYRQLSDNMNVGESLNEAKLQYIEIADEISAHPKNWSGLINYGNHQEILEIEKRTPYLMVSVIVIFIFLLMIIVKKKGR